MNNSINRQKRIIKILKKNLQPQLLLVNDESHLHKGHAGVEKGTTETHFFIEIISKEFRDKNRIDRHRIINSLLDEEFNLGLHAITLKLRDDTEV